MRLLADENFPYPAITALQRVGHDVASVGRDAPGLADRDIFAWAVQDNRVILTFDKDFGQISRVNNASPGCGVILFRGVIPPLSEVGGYLATILDSRSDWEGFFSVVRADRIRRWPLRQP